MALMLQPIKRFNDTFSSNRKIVKRSEIRNLEIHRIDRGCIEDAFCYKSISESVFEIRGFPETEPRRVATLNDRKFHDPVPFP